MAGARGAGGQLVDWVDVARRLQSIAEAGLTYSGDPYDLDRYRALQALAVDIVSVNSSLPPTDVYDAMRHETGYATPKVDVRGVVFSDAKLLMVRERAEQLWSVPGGWADLGESPGECAVKEVREESGLDVRPTKLLAVLDRDRHGHPKLLWHVYKIFLRCELVGGVRATGIETDDVGFFGRDALPPLSTSRITSRQVVRLFEHHDHPDLPTDFD